MCVPISDRANFFWLRPCITPPKLVRVDMVFVLPKAEFRGAGGGFCRGVGRRGIIVLVVPCKAGLEHFEIDVAAINENSADGATVAVGVVDFDADVLAEDKRRKLLLRLLPERLRLLRCVNSVKANLVLRVRRVEDRQRISIGNANDSAANLGAGWLRKRATRRVGGRRKRYAASRGGGGGNLCERTRQNALARPFRPRLRRRISARVLRSSSCRALYHFSAFSARRTSRGGAAITASSR